MEKISEEEHKQHEKKSRKKDSFRIKIKKERVWQGMTAVLALAVLALIFLPNPFTSTGSEEAKQPTQQQNEPQQQNEQKQTERVDVSVDDDPVLGDADAPVTIVSFEDFQCPFCKRSFDQTFPRLKKQYIDTGKVKYVYRDFPLANIHPQAVSAAVAGECAQEQGKFWEYHDALFNNQNRLGQELYLELAEQFSLDMEQFKQCLSSDKTVQEVQKDFNAGRQAGVTGTPAFFINGVKLVGSHPFQNFQEIIEKELANQ